MSFQNAVTVLQRVKIHRARKWQGRKLTRLYFNPYIIHAGVLEALGFGILCPSLLARMGLMFLE